MGRKYNAISVILLILLFFEFFVNMFFLTFSYFEVFTAISVALSFIAITGVFSLKKFGSYCAIALGIYGFVFRIVEIVFNFYYTVLGLVLGFALNAAMMVLGYFEYRQVVNYIPPEPKKVPEPTVYRALYPPQFKESSSENICLNSCPKCGEKLQGVYCYECNIEI